MFGILYRNIVKKVKIPSGNVKQKLRIPVPEKQFLDTSEFSRLSQEYLFKTKNSLQDIKESNPESTLEIQPSSIKFTNKGFSLMIERNFSEQSLQVFVGNGIVHNYFYDLNTERWVCVTDGHLLEELLCREITNR